MSDLIASRKHQLGLARKAEDEARQKSEAATNRVTQLRNQLNQLQSSYETQTRAVKNQLAEAERDSMTASQELQSAVDMKEQIQKLIPPYA